MLQSSWKRSTLKNPAIDFDFELLLLEFLTIVGSKSAPADTQWPTHSNTQTKRISSIERSNTREFLSGSFLDRYQKQLDITKRGIILVMEDMHGHLTNNINQSRLQTVIDVLKTLDTMDPRQVLENSVVECYSVSLGPSDETATQMEFYRRLRKILQPLVQFNFVLKEYYKRIAQKKNSCKSTQCLPSSLPQNLNVLDEEILSNIQSEFSKKQFFELVKAYLRDEQLKIASIKEICRICQCRVNVEKIAQHVQYCQKKHGLTEILSTNFKAMQQVTADIKKAEPRMTVRRKMKDNEEDQIDQEAQKVKRYKKILKFVTTTMNQKRSQTEERMRTIEIQDQLENILMDEDPIIDKFLELLQQRKQILTKLQKNECDHFALKKKSRKLSQKSRGSAKYQKFNFSALQDNNQKIPFERKKSRWATSVDAKSGDLNSEQADNVQNKTVETKNKHERGNKRTRTFIKPEAHLDMSYQQIDQPLYSSQKYIKISEELSSNLSFKDFEVLGFLGKGAFGKVYLVRRLLTNDKYAMKVIKIYEGLDSRKIENIANQHDIFRKISGEFLVKAAFSFSEGGLHMFFLQYMQGGDFSKLLENQVYLEQDIAKFYVAEIVLAIEHLHKLNIIHRDLKPQNLVLDSQGHLKLTDFGLSKEGVATKIQRTKCLEVSSLSNSSDFKEDSSTNSSVLKSQSSKHKQKSSRRKTLLYHSKEKVTLIGTPDYIAPEIIQRISIDNPTIDWWSLGVIVYEILVGQKPFGATTIEDVIDNILNFRIEWPSIGYGQGMMSPEAHDLIVKLLNKDFTKRLGANNINQIKNHEFFKGVNWTQLKHTKAPLQPTLTKFKNQEEDETLRKEIEQSMRRGSLTNENQKKQKLTLNNFIRFDLLSEYTLKSGEQTKKKKELQLQKLSKVAQKIDF